MKQNTSRWMQIVRFTDAQIREIHNAEMSHGRKFLAVKNDRERMRAYDWRISAQSLFDKFNALLPDYWRRGMEEARKEESVNEFEQATFTIWRTCFSDKDANDIQAAHEADLKVKQSGIVPRAGESEGRYKESY